MTYGVVDVGSNTIRLCIYDVVDGQVRALFNNKTTAGLIGYVSNGEMSRKGIKKACDVLNSYKEMAAHTQIKELFVFATASLRNISNTDEALQTIYEETGLKVDVLTGYEEATLDFRGAANSMQLNEGIMVDIGGGSTEILVYDHGNIQDAASMRFGSLSLYRSYVSKLFPKKSEERAMEEKVLSELKKIKFLRDRQFQTLVGIGGTIRAVKNMNNDMFGLPRQNDRVPAKKIPLLLSEFQDEEKDTLKKVLDVAPDRIHTLIPGMLILNTICRNFCCEEILVSNYGVREGYLYKKVVLEE